MRTTSYEAAPDLTLGRDKNNRVPWTDQERQAREMRAILERLNKQPGAVLADEVGMGKTFVALAVAYSVAMRSPVGPVIIMVPSNLLDKWVQDLGVFCNLYTGGKDLLDRTGASPDQLKAPGRLRYGKATRSVDLMRLMDDPPRHRCHLIFMVQGAMNRNHNDPWVSLAMIAEALRKHNRIGSGKMSRVKRSIHRFIAALLKMKTIQARHDRGEMLWHDLIRTGTDEWKAIFDNGMNPDQELDDDPVPKTVIRALHKLDLRPLADALLAMPVRASLDVQRMKQRLGVVRDEIRKLEEKLWSELLKYAGLRSPLLVMDEAHHLKNEGTRLARQFRSLEDNGDLRVGDGALARCFDRMLFLTATPFQLGHHELVNVLRRFGDVRWNEQDLGGHDAFLSKMAELLERLDESQRAAIQFQRLWAKLTLDDVCGVPADWWRALTGQDREQLERRYRDLLNAFDKAQTSRAKAQAAIRPWVLRHNKGRYWPEKQIERRFRSDGAAVHDDEMTGGLPVPSDAMLPFFLAARSAAHRGKDVLGEALSSSYQAFRNTRKASRAAMDDQEEEGPVGLPQDARTQWYLTRFDHALSLLNGSEHPKVCVTVKRVVDLWEEGEKVIVFAFYRETCRALQLHISAELERRLMNTARKHYRTERKLPNEEEVEAAIARVQEYYFDKGDSPGRLILDKKLDALLEGRKKALSGLDDQQRSELKDVFRRFLRARTTLARSFPLARHMRDSVAKVVDTFIAHADKSGDSWQHKIDRFIDILERSTEQEVESFLQAARRLTTGDIYIKDDEGSRGRSLANVQVAMGSTTREARSRLMLAFNTPFFPDILVCSEVMSEGVDLHRFCRHVIHHDLAWNPSTIEQRTGRIDRIGCKAENKHSIEVMLPYIAGAADERQFKVMTDREKWFKVVMGQEDVAKLITEQTVDLVSLPDSVAEQLGFDLTP